MQRTVLYPRFRPPGLTSQPAAAPITRATAVLIDRASPISGAGGLGWRIVSLLTAACAVRPAALAFEGCDNAGKTDASARCNAAALALDALRLKGQRPEQFVLVADTEDAVGPGFADAIKAYADATALKPSLAIVRTEAGTDVLSRRCSQLNVEADVFAYTDAEVVLANLVPLLSGVQG